MADQIKKVQVTGTAAESFLSGNKTRRRPRVVGGSVPRQVQKGGDNSGALVQLTASHLPSVSSVTKVVEPVGATLVKSGVATTISPSPVLKGGAAPVSASKGTDKGVKVVLAPKKKTQKVVLSLAKKVVKLPATPTVVAKKVRGKTHKAARRIRVNVEGLNKRMNRAKTIKKDSQTLTLDQIKADLVAATLIKKDSKAPESILRQMYTDYQLLKQRAL